MRCDSGLFVRAWLFHSMLFFTVLIAAVLAPAGSAAAQATFGMLPQPITSTDLDYYAERLNLSDQQVLAISEHHWEYLDRFRELRDSDIDAFLTDTLDMRRNFSFSNVSKFEPMIRDINRLMGRIRNVDEQFFNQMQTVLTDEQVRQVQRLRQRRERARYAIELTRGLDFINPGARLDLTELIEQLDLPGDVLDRIDPHLAQYENRLTSMARSMWETTMKTLIDAIREIDALGLNEEAMNDPAQMMRLFQEGQRIWDEVSEDMLEESAKLAALHRQHYRAIAPLLPDQSRRIFRQRYLQRAYSEAGRLTVEPWREVEKALSLDDLPARLRQTVLAMANDHDQQQERRINRIADLLDEFRSNLSMQQMIRQGQDPTMQQVNELREEGEQADETFIENLHAILGEPWSARVTAAPAPRRPGAQQPGQRFAQLFAIDENSPQPGLRWPRPIGANDLAHIRETLELDDGHSAALEELHREYVERFNAARRRHMPAIMQLMIDPDDDAAGFMRILDDDELNELIELTRKAIDEIREIEDLFFDEIAGAILGSDRSEALEAVRAMRDCQLHLEATPELPPQLVGGAMNNPGNTEGGVNFREMLSESRLTDDQRRQLSDALVEHELATRDLLRQRLDVDVEMSLRNWQIALGMQDRERRGRTWRAMRAIREPAQRSQTINRQLAQLNRDALGAALEAIPPHERSTLRHRYNRQAFPAIYDDPGSPESKLLAAMNLTELSDRQRGRVQDLAMEFQLQYQQLSQEMVDHYMDLSDVEVPERARRPRMGQGEPPEQVDRDGFRNAIERVRFERDELNQRVQRRLRSILNDEQYNRLSSRSDGF